MQCKLSQGNSRNTAPLRKNKVERGKNKKSRADQTRLFSFPGNLLARCINENRTDQYLIYHLWVGKAN